MEETGLEVKLDGLIGLYSGGGSVVILAAYSATIAGESSPRATR